MLGGIGDGFKVAMSGARLRALLASPPAASASARAALDESVAYAKERTQFDRPIAGFQLVQAMLADMVVRTEAARMLVCRAGALKDAGRPSTIETSIAKLYASESAVVRGHGDPGPRRLRIRDDHPVERFFRDARVTTIYEGTSQIQKLIIGRAATGIDALKPLVIEPEPLTA